MQSALETRLAETLRTLQGRSNFAIILLGVIACLAVPVYAQDGPPPPFEQRWTEPPEVSKDDLSSNENASEDSAENSDTDSAEDDSDEDEDDDLDSLLNLADKDLGQLSQVQISKPAAVSVAPSMDTVVSTVERKESTVGKTPAAVFVISNEMIRRSGVRSVPEALRMAPGVQVSRIDANKWAISMRGFNSRFSNKLLVQIDGRSVYNPLFGGMLWDVQNVLLEDVERIEVVRGPGGVVWGANAVNGVINVVTKNAKDTLGTFFEAGGGNFERGFASFRHGFEVGPDAAMRVYGTTMEREAFRSPTNHDDWRSQQIGTRLDWSALDDDYTLQADVYHGTSGNAAVFATPTTPFSAQTQFDENVSGGNVLFRRVHTTSDDESWQFQTYYDNTNRRFSNGGFEYELHTVDIDFQHRFQPWKDHDLIWGGAYRAYWDESKTQPYFLSLNPTRDNFDIVSGFVQDTMTLIDEKLFFVLGTKISHNDFTGLELQPSARLLWTPDPKYSMWLAASRAVRTATRLTRDGRVILPGTDSLIGAIYPVVNGTSTIDAENVFALEVGFREQVNDRFAYDIALYSNRYDDLVGVNGPFGFSAGPEGTIAPATFGNTGSATAWGAEIASNYEVSDNWSLRGSYTFLKLDFDGSVLGSAGDSPQNQLYLQSSHDLATNTELDFIWRFVDNLPGQNVESYSAFDIRLGWKPNDHVEVYGVGQNLLDSSHFEFGNDAFAGTQATAVPRGFYGGVAIRY